MFRNGYDIDGKYTIFVTERSNWFFFVVSTNIDERLPRYTYICTFVFIISKAQKEVGRVRITNAFSSVFFSRKIDSSSRISFKLFSRDVVQFRR